MSALITTIIYGASAVYLLYYAAMHIFIYFANTSLGHAESLKRPLIYLVSGLIMAALTYLGYRIYKSMPLPLLLKILFYLPASLVILYLLWAVIMVISSGGKWN
jgi:hypothetical protein